MNGDDDVRVLSHLLPVFSSSRDLASVRSGLAV
jgi:hypothetical protein